MEIKGRATLVGDYILYHSCWLSVYSLLYITFLMLRISRCLLYFRKIYALLMQKI